MTKKLDEIELKIMDWEKLDQKAKHDPTGRELYNAIASLSDAMSRMKELKTSVEQTAKRLTSERISSSLEKFDNMFIKKTKIIDGLF